MHKNRAGLHSESWRALGTGVRLVVAAEPAAARRAVEEVLAAVELAASRFREDSELSRLRPGTWTEVSPLLARALVVARDAARDTDGLVDPTLGAALAQLGYDRTFALVVPDAGPVTVTARPGGWQRIEVDGTRARVPAGVDLGATAKALAADLAAASAGAVSGEALVSLGGDIATAGARVWPVRVADVADDGKEGQVIGLTGCLATSGTAARRWTRGGRVVHHLLDPRTCLPTSGPWRTVSVLAGTCVQANTAATASVVLGEDAVPWLRERNLDARLVRDDGTVVHVGGWPVPT